MEINQSTQSLSEIRHHLESFYKFDVYFRSYLGSCLKYFLMQPSSSERFSSSKSSSSIKKLKYNSQQNCFKWQILLLILIFNCLGQLNANPSRSSNLPSYLQSFSNETESIADFSSYLMSFFPQLSSINVSIN